MDVTISRAKLRTLLFGALGLVVGAGITVEVVGAMYGLKRRSGIVPLLSLSYEWNLPTLYTALLLVLCALSTALMAMGVRKTNGKFGAHWWALAAGFAYIAVDEILGIHEKAHAIPYLVAGPSLKLGGVLHFAWVIPAAIVVLVVGLSFIPFLRHLPPRLRNGCLIAGTIYVGGAVGMELPLGWWAERMGTHNLGYALIDAVEESMEMLGLNLFLLVMLEHFAAAGCTIRFSSGHEDPTQGDRRQTSAQEQSP
jgi:hypothetical protein